MSDLKELYENSHKELLEHYAGLTAHDFNNMINAVQSAAQLLSMEKDKLGTIGQRSLGIIEKTTERMSEMTTRLQEVRSFTPEESECFSAEDVLRTILNQLELAVPLEAEEDVVIFSCRKTFGNLILWLSSSLKGLEKINLCNRELDEDHCRNSRFPIGPGRYCQMEFIFQGSRPDNLYDPWAGPPRLFAFKRSVLKLRGEIESPPTDKEKWSLIIRLPSSEL